MYALTLHVIMHVDMTIGSEVHVRSSGHSSPDRHGTVVAVLGPREREHYLVRWSDGRESLLHRSACEPAAQARHRAAAAVSTNRYECFPPGGRWASRTAM